MNFINLQKKKITIARPLFEMTHLKMIHFESFSI